jgi:hypothetical protein
MWSHANKDDNDNVDELLLNLNPGANREIRKGS